MQFNNVQFLLFPASFFLLFFVSETWSRKFADSTASLDISFPSSSFFNVSSVSRLPDYWCSYSWCASFASYMWFPSRWFRKCCEPRYVLRRGIDSLRLGRRRRRLWEGESNLCPRLTLQQRDVLPKCSHMWCTCFTRCLLLLLRCWHWLSSEHSAAWEDCDEEDWERSGSYWSWLDRMQIKNWLHYIQTRRKRFCSKAWASGMARPFASASHASKILSSDSDLRTFLFFSRANNFRINCHRVRFRLDADAGIRSECSLLPLFSVEGIRLFWLLFRSTVRGTQHKRRGKKSAKKRDLRRGCRAHKQGERSVSLCKSLCVWVRECLMILTCNSLFSPLHPSCLPNVLLCMMSMMFEQSREEERERWERDSRTVPTSNGSRFMFPSSISLPLFFIACAPDTGPILPLFFLPSSTAEMISLLMVFSCYKLAFRFYDSLLFPRQRNRNEVMCERWYRSFFLILNAVHFLLLMILSSHPVDSFFPPTSRLP